MIGMILLYYVDQSFDIVMLSDVQIVVQPGSLAARKYSSWQKLSVKNHALLSRIETIWQN